MEKLLEILKEIRSDVDFEKETKLIDDAIIDSFDIISIISEVNEAYDIEIDVLDISPENFNSAASLLELINKYLDR